MPAIGQANLNFHRVYRAMVTASQMMADRGYLVAADMIPDTFDDFMQRYVVVDDQGNSTVLRGEMTLPCERHRDKDGSTIPPGAAAALEATAGAEEEPQLGFRVERAIVLFDDIDSLNSSLLHQIVEKATSSGWDCKSIICVFTVKPNLLIQRLAAALNRERGIKIEIFEEDDLAVNITQHELVPKHTPLSEKELREVLQAHAIQKIQLPRLLTSDPVARYFGLERGQVVKIERKSASAGVYVTYRQVV
eukprot:gene12586-8625_t